MNKIEPYFRKIILVSFSFALGFFVTSHIYQLFFVPSKINPEFVKYHESFIKESHRSILPFISHMKPNIVFADPQEFLPNNHPAHCVIIIGKKPDVFINPITWNTYPDSQKEMIIFHELAHCLLFRGHASVKEDADSPPSIMVSIVPNQRFYSQNREFYLKELFSYKLSNISESINSLLFKDQVSFLK